MISLFTVGTFGFHLSACYSGQVQLRTVAVNGKKVTLFRLDGLGMILSNRANVFDIRDDTSRINRSLRLAWCRLAGMPYKQLMDSVAKSRALEARERFSDQLEELHTAAKALEVNMPDKINNVQGDLLTATSIVIDRLRKSTLRKNAA